MSASSFRHTHRVHGLGCGLKQCYVASVSACGSVLLVATHPTQNELSFLFKPSDNLIINYTQVQPK